MKMKKLILLCMTIALTGVLGIINAQNKSGMSDKALSAQYKHEISVLESEIKTVKIKLKADKTNTNLQSDLAVKQAQLKELKSKKKVIDNAIKSKTASEKAHKKAEKAQEKAEKHAANAQKLKDSE
jgi:septal ring factor EnvC (AmiA/AmiB activator)